MSKDLIVSAGKLSKSANPIAITDSVDKIAGAFFDYMSIRETEITKRTEITERSKVAIERIRSQKEVFLSIIENEYKSRAYVYSELFRRMDKGIEMNDIRIVELAMSGIISQIKKDPFSNFIEFKNKISDTEFVDDF